MWWGRYFQTIILVLSNSISLKYQRLSPLGGKDLEIIKAKTELTKIMNFVINDKLNQYN